MFVRIFSIIFLLLCSVTSLRSTPYTRNASLYAALTEQAVNSFYQCQAAAVRIRLALQFGIRLPNTPRQLVSEKNVSFILFNENFSTPYNLVISEGEASIRSSPFKPEARVILFADGYNGSSSRSAGILPQAILSSDKNVNLIIFNWDSYNTFEINYTRNLTVPRLGNIVAKFVKQLIAVGADPKKMYFIGFSAGCQILGLAAKQITPKVDRFLVLDPQGSCFNFLPSTKRVDKSDADFVIIVHSSVGMRALPLYITGDVTFYINGGFVQEPCLNQTDLNLLNTCSHEFCVQAFFDSLFNFNMSVGIRCRSYKEYLYGSCDCRDTLIFGYRTPQTASSGLYFVDTIPFQASRNNPSCSKPTFWF